MSDIIPRSIRGTLYILLLVPAGLSMPLLGRFSPLPTTLLLDIWFVVFVLFAFINMRTSQYLFVFAILAYLFTRIVPAIASSAPLFDFLQSYRWLFYLIALLIGVNKRWIPFGPIVILTWTLILMALLKATLSLAFLGPGGRPGLLLENNFELALFAGLVIVIYRSLSPRQQLWILGLLGVLTLLAGSRSGAVAFLVVVFYAFLEIRSTNILLKFVGSALIPVAGLFVLVLFVERFAQDGQIDRLYFFQVFLDETRDWTPLNWMFGTMPITPLSPVGCAALSYYDVLFSSEGDGTCYSVILHSFIMRVIFDAGLLGLLISTFVPGLALRRAGVDWRMTLCLVAIAISNGMSVSGINNPYVALPILLAVLTTTRDSPSLQENSLPPRPNKEYSLTPK